MTDPRAPVPAPYTLRQIQQMLALSPRVIAGLVRAGFVTPSRGPRNEYRFTFQDVVLMRTARALEAAAIPTRRILKALRSLRESLPAEMPLSGLRITAVGDRVAVRQADAQWEPESGQLVMDFEVADEKAVGDVASLSRADAPRSTGSLPPRTSSEATPVRRRSVEVSRSATSGASPAAAQAQAVAFFERGIALEDTDRRAAEHAYRRAIALAPSYGDPYLNLGALLTEAGRTVDAAKVYETALTQGVTEPLLYFNLAIVLEDLGRPETALACYAECLARAPDFADAHFNAARLHQELGHAQLALRHFSAYRRLQKSS